MIHRNSALAVVLISLVVSAVLAGVAAQSAAAVPLKQKLRAAKKGLRDSSERLLVAEAALAAVRAADPAAAGESPPGIEVPPEAETRSESEAPPESDEPGPATPGPEMAPGDDGAASGPTIDQLEGRVLKLRRSVRIWRQRVRNLTQRYRLQRRMKRWERRGQWRPIIRIAAARYRVRAAGIHRLMMSESGGRRRAGSGTPFKGLFQYHARTWTAGWNPHRRRSIYDGRAQIFATCYAVSRGMGPALWGGTFRSRY